MRELFNSPEMENVEITMTIIHLKLGVKLNPDELHMHTYLSCVKSLRTNAFTVPICLISART